jgi:hypothetical protein
VTLSFLLTQNRPNLHLFLARYLVIIVPPIALLAALGVKAAMRYRREAGAVLGVALIALALPAMPKFFADEQLTNYKTPAAWLEQNYQAGDGIICFPQRKCAINLTYYLAGFQPLPQVPPTAPGGWDWPSETEQPSSIALVQTYAASHRRLFFIQESGMGPTPGYITDPYPIYQWLSSHGQRIASTSAKGASTVYGSLYVMETPQNRGASSLVQLRARSRSTRPRRYSRFLGVISQVRFTMTMAV